MAKTLQESSVTTRAARSKLPAGLHWRGIDTGIHLGYRRSRRGGEWMVRWRAGAGYKREGIGAADDVLAADGQQTLSFDQALVADLHDTSAKMIEAHYSKWIADAETEMARRAIVALI